ncbi:helix-turn-helix transcriptional regulator [Burkholderia ubonensis]|uniref:response regulator transcription factor n=1 Tax=Burkholderia ubonensis TaxID=101571 RepID=UPI000757783C|nr:response regulator transcription factor [Burkholderia ubonensis]KVO88904.1 helix-turn-helix transcriptional regulator [Burkholderia ubonensis]KVO89435.1 helix-turn-helix transcriptional regulator [Burkholderia ubonensis]KVQ07256.1 helix-turn-helix transcriptional regulator [Burkholderia ubonensis]KVR03624.1 helix-turn-helix transcriptional regulator [Burkholderia ubonensis]KVU38276.1 helix-turn-helix transcriptional regulator [Burkholderia ubonensis]
MQGFRVQAIFANDRPLTLAGMEHVAGNTNAIDLVGLCKSADELVSSLHQTKCDVALIDFSMRARGQMEGVTLFGYLCRNFAELRIIALVTHENQIVLRSLLNRGVSAIVSKFDDVGHIVTAIHTSYGGGRYLSPSVKNALGSENDGKEQSASKLTPREMDVVRLYLSGMSVKEIAAKFRRGKQTISAQKMSAMKKLGVKGDVELVKCAFWLGLLDESNSGGANN